MNIAAFSSLLTSTGPTSFWLPEQASTNASHIDALFMFILYLSAFFFVGIVAFMIYFVVRYRKRSATQTTSPISGHHGLELTWSVIPSIILVGLFIWGFRSWMDLNVPPGNAMEVKVTARRWKWQFTYPYHGGIEGVDLQTKVPTLFVPVNKPVKLLMSSSDVIHSFYVPAFRIKKDVLPNRYTVVWFEATKTGTFDVYCTEYCGRDHSTMFAHVKVLPEEEFNQWVESGGGTGNLSPVEFGKTLFTSKGCNACHSLSADRMNLPGPPLGGVFGKTETMASGESVKIDENYLREAILEPNAKVVQGYQPVMPTFKGSITDPQLDALIAYIKSLK